VPIAGEITYSTTGATNQDVVVTLTLNKTGRIATGGALTSNGWTAMCVDIVVGTVQETVRPCNEVAGDENMSQQRQKTFTGNTTENVIFTDEAGTQGMATVQIDRIDKLAPQALALMYSPSTLTNGKVKVTLLTDKRVEKPEGREGATT
jgi:hypothetical protein